jgi:hypothetical protein
MEERLVEVTGNVSRENIDARSKSGRQAIILETADGRRYTLRMRDAPAFGGSGIDDLVGSSITIKGIAIDQTLIMQEWKVVE